MGNCEFVKTDQATQELISEITTSVFDPNKTLKDNINIIAKKYLPLLIDPANSKLLWSAYAKCYHDGLNNLIPYAELQEDIAESVDLKPNENKVIIDLGCGPSSFGRMQKNRAQGNHVIGLDLSETMLREGKSNFNEGGLVLCDFENNLPVKNHCADIVVSTNVLGFLNNPEKFISEIWRILKPYGNTLLTTHKQNFDLAEILKEHYYASSNQDIDPEDTAWDTSTPKGFAASFERAFQASNIEVQQKIALIAICNMALPRQSIAYAPNEQEIKELFTKNGFSNVTIKPTYADQYFKVSASPNLRSDLAEICQN